MVVMPLPGTRVVHPDWSRHHQPVATGGMNASCVITDPARMVPGGPLGEDGTYPPPVPFVVLPTDPTSEDGWLCRVQALQSDNDTEQAGQESTSRAYLIQLDDPDLSTLPDLEVGYLVEIVTARNDPHLVGLSMPITDVQHGSERFTRDLTVTHSQQPPTT